MDFTENAGSQTITITSGESWNYEKTGWVTVERNGDDLEITTAANPNETERTATITINGCETKVVTVSQDGKTPEPCSFSAPSEVQTEATAAEETITITSNYPWDYTYDEDDGWYTVSRSGDVLSVSVLENDGTISRTSQINISGCENQVITVSQEGKTPEPCSFSAPSEVQTEAAATEETITITSNYPWDFTYDEDDGFYTVLREGDDLKVSITENTSTEIRVGLITITGCSAQIVTVSQERGADDLLPILPGTTEVIVTGSQVYLDWEVNCGDGFSHYEIERDNTLLSDDVPVSRYTDEGIANGTYTYDIYLINDAGNRTGFYSIQVIVSESDVVAVTPFIPSVETSKNADVTKENIAYPNPATDVLHVGNVSKGTVLNLYDSNGKLMQNVSAKDGEVDIDVSRLTAGLYFLKVGNVTRKIMVK